MEHLEMHSLRKQAHHLQPLVRIGKAGVSGPIIEEIKRLLKSKKLIKIRLLRSCADLYDSNQIIDSIITQTNSSLISKSGNTVVLYGGK